MDTLLLITRIPDENSKSTIRSLSIFSVNVQVSNLLSFFTLNLYDICRITWLLRNLADTSCGILRACVAFHALQFLQTIHLLCLMVLPLALAVPILFALVEYSRLEKIDFGTTIPASFDLRKKSQVACGAERAKSGLGRLVADGEPAPCGQRNQVVPASPDNATMHVQTLCSLLSSLLLAVVHPCGTRGASASRGRFCRDQ